LPAGELGVDTSDVIKRAAKAAIDGARKSGWTLRKRSVLR